MKAEQLAQRTYALIRALMPLTIPWDALDEDGRAEMVDWARKLIDDSDLGVVVLGYGRVGVQPILDGEERGVLFTPLAEAAPIGHRPNAHMDPATVVERGMVEGEIKVVSTNREGLLVLRRAIDLALASYGVEDGGLCPHWGEPGHADGRCSCPRPGPAEVLAKRFHETYERMAPKHDYETRAASAVPWAEVPANNRALMVAVCAELLGDIPDLAENMPDRADPMPGASDE